ncbi:hypothetical protein EDC04DRAFT_2900264 [Pisolithus marmoratus]|nr:hypothetical protein EDC04DRAFT_2900264 [Pisolithus marmoratus]
MSSWLHEFLLVHVDVGVDGEKCMLILERFPENRGIRVMFSDGGVAKDTITVVRARENHEYWRKAGEAPVCRGTLQWRDHLPHLLDIVSIANAASAAFKYYNCYVRQCYWYARVILASMAKAFQPFSKEGATSFSKRRFAIFGNHKISQVQFLVDLHAIYGYDTSRQPTSIVIPCSLQDIHTLFAGCFEKALAQKRLAMPGNCQLSQVQFPVDLHTTYGRDTRVYPPPPHAAFIVTPDSLQDISSLLAGYLEKFSAQLLWPQPAAAAVHGCCDRIMGREHNSAGGWT